MPNGEEKIVHPQGTIPGLDTPFEVSKQRLDEFTGGSIDGFWSQVLNTPPTKGEVAQYYPLKSVDISGRYDYYAPYRDTEESYAMGQSTWDKVGNGLVKMGGLAIGTVLEGTIGLVNGVGKWIESGEFSKLYDNDFNRSIDEWNKKLENQFPHYYTHKELDADWYEPASLFTGNFLWDKVVKNLGFAVGAIATGGVYSATFKALGLTGWLVRQGKGLELLASLEQTVPMASRANRLAAFTESAGSLALKYGAKPLGNVLQKSDRILTAAMATTGEASIEALNNLNEFRNNAIKEWEEKYGEKPTGADLQRINEYAENVGNWSFGLNTALLTATNYVQLPKILGSSYKAEKSIANNIQTQPLLRDATTGLYKSALPNQGVKKLLTKSKNVASLFFAPVEAFEEGAQYSIQRGTEHYFNKKMTGEKVNWLEDAFGYAIDKTLNTKEGMENILIGGLSGGLMTMKANIKERGLTGYGGERGKATQEALNGLNKSTFKKQLQDYAEASKRAQVSQERRAIFIRQGDILEAKEEEFDFTHDYLLPRIKYGKIEGVKEDLNMYRQLSSTPEGMAQLKNDGIATPDDTQQTFLVRLAAIEEHANIADTLYKSLNLKYAGITNEKGERKYSDDTIDRLVYAAAKIKNYDSRSSVLSANLSMNGVDSSPILQDINEGKDPKVESVRKALDSINENNALTADEKDDLKRELQDLMEIRLRRNRMVDEYDNIRKDPAKYQPFVVTEEDLKSPTVKYGEKELTIDTPYSLKDPFIREGNRLILAPKLTLLSKTLQGEYDAKLPSGRQGFLTPKELENYQLSEVDNASKEVATALDKAIDSVFALKKYEDIKDQLPKTLDEKLAYVNALDRSDLSDDIVARVSDVIKAEKARKEKERKELEEIEKQKKLKDKVFKDQSDLKGEIVNKTPTADDILKEAEPRKKAAPIVFSSSTSASEDDVPDTQASPRLLRERSFLFNQAFFKNRSDYKIIVVTQNQEDKLGLNGLIESVAKDDTEREWTNTDVDNGTILAIYVLAEKGNLYYVDEKGNKVGKVGETVDFNKIVVSTLSNTSTTWRNGESRFRKEDQDMAGAFSEQWRAQRQNFFNAATFSTFEFSVSRGLPKYDTYEEDGVTKMRENPLVNALYPESEKDKINSTEGVIQVAVTDAISYNNVNYGTEQGRVYFQYQDRFAPLTNRQLTDEEKQAIWESLLAMADQAKENKGIKGRHLNFIKGILYFGSPVDAQGNAKTPGRNQIWIDKTFFLNFGNNGQRIAFLRSALEHSKDLFFAFLDNTYNNINNSILRDDFHTAFEEFYIDKESGKLTSKQWKNYQTFLFEKGLLRTPIRQISPSVPNDRNFKQKYAILHGIEFVAPKKEEKKEKPKTSPKKEREEKLQEFITSKGEKLYYTIDNDGNVNVSTTGDYKQAIDRFKELEVVKKSVEKGNDAELAARVAIQVAISRKLKESPKVGSVVDEDLEAKKADIERRRQEELNQLEKELNDLGIVIGENNLKETAEKVLEDVQSPFVKQLLKALLNLISKTGTTLIIVKEGGIGYNPSQNKITIGVDTILDGFNKNRENRSKGTTNGSFSIKYGKSEGTAVSYFATTLLHEIVHTFTSKQIDVFTGKTKGELTKEETEILNNLQKIFNLVKTNPILKGEYGLYDLHELIAEIFSNETFADKLKNISLPKELQYKTKSKNLFEGIIDLISDLITKAIKGFTKQSINNEETAFQNISNLVNDLINAKYDAELAELEKAKSKQTPSKAMGEDVGGEKEQSKPKEIKIKGRKDSEYRLVRRFNVQTMGFDERRDFNHFMEKNLPQFIVQEMEEIIQATGDRYAWGRLYENVIEYYKNAETGTGYHEAFEGVWKYFLLPGAKAAILDEVSKREGAFIDRETGDPIAYSDATEQQLKEHIADQFAEYKTGKKPKNIGQKLRAFFDRLIKFFRTFLTGYKVNKSLTEELFKQIERGEFAKFKLPSTFDNTTEYREVKGLTAAQTHGFVQDILANFMIELFNEGADMFEGENYQRGDIFNVIKEFYSEKEDGLSTIDQLPEGEKTFDELVKKVKKILGAYSITFDEEGVVSINDENQTRIDYDSSSQKMTLDIRKTQPFAVKLLLATLYKTTEELSSAGLPLAERGIVDNYQLLQPSRTTVTLLETALGSTSVDDMIDKFKALAAENSDYIRLIRRLGFDLNRGDDSSFAQLTPEKFRLLSGFWDSFNKQKPFVRELVIGDNTYFQDMHIGSTSKQVFNQWENAIRRNARNGKGVFKPYDKKEKQYAIDKEALAGYKANISNKSKVTSEEQLKFLNDIGIDFHKNVYDKMSIKQKDAFSNAINRILTYMSDKGGLKIVTGEVTGIRGSLNTLSELYARIVKPDAESTFLNGENKQQQVFIQPNYTSQFENIFNSVKDITELRESLPYLNDVYTRNSEVFRLGGVYFNEDGTRTDVTIKNGYINALSKDGRRRLMKDVDIQDRLAIQINSILQSDDKRQGIYFISVPADASTEYSITLPNFLTYKDLLNIEESTKKIVDKMYAYLEDEVALAMENRDNANIAGKGNQLRFFADILSAPVKAQIDSVIAGNRELSTVDRTTIDADFINYVNSKVSATRRNLELNSVITEAEPDVFVFPSLLSGFAEANDLNIWDLKRDDLDRIIKQFWFNNFIAQTELHKVLFGDPFNFAVKGKVLDETKRIKSFLSPAQPTLVSKYYNNLYNDIFNKAGDIVLESPELGRYNFRDFTTSMVIKEVEIVGTIANEKDQYGKIKEADAQAGHTIEMHRDLKNRHWKWGKKEEEWYQFEKAYERLRRNLKGQLKDENYPAKLKEHDIKLIGWDGETNTLPRPEVHLNVEKPIVRGVKYGKNTIDTVLDKFSSAPIFFSAVEGTSLEDVYLQMQREGIDYFILESGRKVGAEEYRNFYNQDGSLNRFPVTNQIKISWEDYYIQQENVYSESGTQTRGTQITKLFSLDFFTGGEPIDGDPEIAEKAQYNDLLLNELTIDGYNRVLKRLGLVDNGTYFSFKGTTEGREKLMDTLRKESYKRDMPDNVRDIFERNPDTGAYDIAIEATSEYTKIQKILYAIADREILTQHYNGGQRTQMSVLGWENRLKGRDIVLKEEKDGKINYRKISRKEYQTLTDEQKKNIHLTSSKLKFYSKDDRYMEVLLPNWFRNKLRGFGKTDADILTYLNTTEEGKKILRGIGFRIPTQAMSQIEAIRVAGFLAPEMGDTVVVPSEITTKSGSDFDIDKLNTYLKNVYVGMDGLPRLDQFHKVDVTDEADLTLFYENNILRKYKIFKEREKILSSELSVDALFTLLGFNPDTAELESSIANKYVPKLEEFLIEAKTSTWFELNKQYHPRFRQALENEYIENLEWFITHPKNYERLTTPTEEGDLKPLAAEIVKLTEVVEKDNVARLLDINYLASTRQAFMSAKKWIGIVVNGITSHAQAQRVNIYMDVKSVKLSEKDKEILKDGRILLPHNIDSEGRPTISVLKNRAGKYISDILSWFCTAMVDVAKDPYITKIIHNKKLVPVFTFLVRVGVPTRMLGYFMNQPIIREYMKFSDEMGFSKVANDYWRDRFLSHNKFPATEKAEKLDPNQFKEVIGKYYDGTPLTNEENAHQVLILDEFLKYFRMSEYLFNFTQATNWDTADFKTSGAIYKKQVIEQRENKNNIFKSPKTLVDSTFLRTMADSIILMRDAIGTLSRFDNAVVRNELDKILRPFVSVTSFQSADVVEKIDTGIVSTFIDYLIQTNTGLNRTIHNVLVQESTSVATMVQNVQTDPELLKQYNNNPIFAYLKAQISNFENGADNLVLRPFPKQVYDKDLISDSLRELRELSLAEDGSVNKGSIYSGIIRLALLQGTGNASNLLPYIPLEDFAQVLMPLMGTNLPEQAKEYARNSNFERNWWTDDDVVPEFTPAIFASKTPDSGGFYVDYKADLNFPYPEWQGRVLRLSETFNSREVEYPLLKVRRAPQIKRSYDRYDFMTNRLLRREGPADGFNVKALVAKGDFSFLDWIGYQKVLLPNGEPLTKTIKERGKWVTYYYYKQVNLMGDRNLQEHYKDQRPSVLDNQTVKIAQENILTDQEVIDKVQGRKGPDKGGNQPVAPTPKTPTPSTQTGKNLPMQPDNIEKIKSGKKTITNRTGKFPDGIYSLSDGTKVEVKYIGKAEVELIQGNWNDENMPETDLKINGKSYNENKFAREEGFENWKDFVSNNKFSNGFIKNGETRYIYSIKPVAPSSKVEPKQEFPKITEIQRSNKKEKYSITLSDGKVEEREGYRLSVKEYPDFQGFLNGSSKEGWAIDELTTGKTLGVTGDTIKEVLPKLVDKLNKLFEEPKWISTLEKIGLFTVQKNKETIGFKKGKCK